MRGGARAPAEGAPLPEGAALSGREHQMRKCQMACYASKVWLVPMCAPDFVVKPTPPKGRGSLKQSLPLTVGGCFGAPP